MKTLLSTRAYAETGAGKRAGKTTGRILLFLPAALLAGLLSCTLAPDGPVVEHISIKEGQVIEDVTGFHRIDIRFSMPMNRYVTERHVSVSGYYERLGYRWDSRSRGLTLVLDDGLAYGQEYTLLIDRGCESSEGIDLAGTYTRRFRTYRDEDRFAVLATRPAAGRTVKALDSLRIEIDFSLPLGQVTVYDKVQVDPSLVYAYSFSTDRRTLALDVLQPLEPNRVYTITLDDTFRSEGGRLLQEGYAFSFNTIIGHGPFTLEGAWMVPPGQGPGSPEAILLDTGEHGTTGGVEKEMELLLAFSRPLYLTDARAGVSIEPALSHAMVMEAGPDSDGVPDMDSALARLRFDHAMAPEETCLLCIDRSLSSADGIPLDRDYRFSWTVDGPGSRLLEVASIQNLHPHGGSDLVLHDGSAPVHNQELLTELAPDGSVHLARFILAFSAPLDVYPALACLRLAWRFGDTRVSGGTLESFQWDGEGGELTAVYRLGCPDSPGSAYYKLILEGGEGGVRDTGGNTMAESIEVYVIYAWE